MAYVFPQKCKLNYEDDFYPGVICLIKEVVDSGFDKISKNITSK